MVRRKLEAGSNDRLVPLKKVLKGVTRLNSRDIMLNMVTRLVRKAQKENGISTHRK